MKCCSLDFFQLQFIVLRLPMLQRFLVRCSLLFDIVQFLRQIHLTPARQKASQSVAHTVGVHPTHLLLPKFLYLFVLLLQLRLELIQIVL